MDPPFYNLREQEKEIHFLARKDLKRISACTSHSVLLIDTSGSMRNSDVQGCRSRLSAVMYSIAMDFVSRRIMSGVASSSDAISIILMGETPTLWIDAWPTDWRTYNVILKAYKSGWVHPHGHACFRPSIEMAEKILLRYDSSSCRLMLGVFSDGRPSDASVFRTSWKMGTQSICESIESMASRLGNRLAIHTIGMGSVSEFEMFQDICACALSYGCEASVELPSLSTSGLGAAVSSIASSLTETRDESPRRVRRVTREKENTMPVLTEWVDTKEFSIFRDDVLHQK
jgi:hypothetical protein